MQWFLAKVKYPRLVKGERKIFTEQYLLYCATYGDVEATAPEILKKRIKNPDFDNIGKVRITRNNVFKMSETVMTDVEGVFFQVNVEFDMGEGKKETETFIVNAKKPEVAIQRIYEKNHASVQDYKVTGVKETKIDGIYDKGNDVWVQDFENRMNDMEFDGKVEADINQTTIPFGEDVNKKSDDDTTADLSGLDDAIFGPIKDILNDPNYTVSSKGPGEKYVELGKGRKKRGVTEANAAMESQEQYKQDRDKLAEDIANQFGASEATISGSSADGSVVDIAHFKREPETTDEPFAKEPIENKFARAEGREIPFPDRVE
ncbi:MAG TPA: DUF4494 family protein [Fibrella sp.]|jgi:hypothetical protein